jgi:two-component system sensor histidine kinase PilS (NtrC family)
VLFDPEHLRRVLVNLLDNARRHASDRPGAIFLRLTARDEARRDCRSPATATPIPPEVERYLFEPFFSTRSRGTGPRPVYLPRAVRALRRQHRIPRPPGRRLRNEFRVVMRAAPLPAHATLGLTVNHPRITACSSSTTSPTCARSTS